MVMVRFISSVCFAAFLSVLTLEGRTPCHAAPPKQPAVQDQMEATILHVDKYGVYVPSIIFYWPPEMSKQKIAALTHAAGQLRNRKALITFTSVGGVPSDKRPLLVDLTPIKEGMRPAKDGFVREEQTRDVKVPADEAKQGQDLRKSESGEAVAERPTLEGQPELRPLRNKYKLPVAEDYGTAPNPAPAEKQTARFDTGDQAPKANVNSPQTVPQDATGSRRDAERVKPAGPQTITKDEVVAFIRRILALTSRKDINSILPHYGERVNYYDRGMVDIDYIRKDMGYYFKNWDTITCALDGDVVMIVTDQQDMRIVKFVSTFSVQNSKKSVSGKTENIWKLQRVNDQLKIVDEKQKTLTTERRP